MNLASYGVASFQVAGNRATWTLAAPISADKLRLTLPGGIADTSGNPMGTDYTLRFDVHPGDVNIDTAVNRADLVHNFLYQFTNPGLAEYDPLQDVDTNGRINILDWMRIRDRFGTILPPGQPGGSPASADAMIAVVSTGENMVRRATTKHRATDIVLNAATHQVPDGTRTVVRSTISRKAISAAPAVAIEPPAREVNSLATLRARRSSSTSRIGDAPRDAVFAGL